MLGIEKKQKLRWAGLVSVLALGLVGCVEPVDSPPVAEAESPSSASEALPEIWYINVLTAYELYNTSQKLFEDSADQIGYVARTAGSPTVDIPGQIDLIKQAVASGAEAIIFCNLDPVSYVGTIKEAQAAGVVMITSGGCVDEDSDYSVGTDNREFGEVAARTIAGEVGEDAKVIIFGTNNAVPNQVITRDGFSDYIEANFPDMEILSVESTEADPAIAAAKIAAVLVSYPEANAFWHIEGAGLSAIPKTLEQAGLQPGDMYVLGVDSTPETISAIESGWVSSTLAQCFFYATPFIAQLAVKKLAGVGPAQQSFPVDVIAVGPADLPFTECPSSAFPAID